MHAQAHLALHHLRAAELHAEAEEYRLARSARAPRPLRTVLGWTLIEVGLRLTAPASRPALARV
ncbi:hypothetical protein [Streptomyces drozdowiczii]|uniref:Uncharacterized protein n=1 Tax=Streptomyces drozdowiczii TaxID=202862 RepID=A0ABY6PMX2_9ACTN|nr:hypothetical protein [Streptomyces drozdowiczii]MCX0247037.1 hypothetical protein [Streptomyces drozdowiczii]UZK53525.1 hypothetical protein NEH16_04660 [Streptomyces drozdowiczii]